MINTISLSTDLKSLYLIDKGRVTTYDLTDAKGILITKAQGQLFVASGLENQSSESESTLLIELKDNSQLTLSYNQKTAALGLIGATDIIQTITAPTDPPTGNCSLNLFSLDSHDLHIVRKGDTLAVTKLAKEC